MVPVLDCADVPGLDLGGVTDAPVTIQPAKPGAAPYCKVRAGRGRDFPGLPGFRGQEK
ncbi:hypothetical protein L1857_18120 [Amycolatopsis thermalba]|uniref:Uncharacterized protein n=1 Tax=Amycolatopsis thermalba TaxID=944492 RepID=A0ABY4NWZ2_9PSEU|nr:MULTISPECIES: hypothetical protein [Amycolatopsis]UQS24595.1 hypothetical protein L1857_18120 [Amycolatopsis thermalba]